MMSVESSTANTREEHKKVKANRGGALFEAFMVQIESEADLAKQVDFRDWLSFYEDVRCDQFDIATARVRWAEYEAVCWAMQVDYPESEFWYKGKWEAITRW